MIQIISHPQRSSPKTISVISNVSLAKHFCSRREGGKQQKLKELLGGSNETGTKNPGNPKCWCRDQEQPLSQAVRAAESLSRLQNRVPTVTNPTKLTVALGSVLIPPSPAHKQTLKLLPSAFLGVSFEFLGAEVTHWASAPRVSIFFVVTRSHYVVKAGLKLTASLPPQPPVLGLYACPPHPASPSSFNHSTPQV